MAQGVMRETVSGIERRVAALEEYAEQVKAADAAYVLAPLEARQPAPQARRSHRAGEGRDRSPTGRGPARERGGGQALRGRLVFVAEACAVVVATLFVSARASCRRATESRMAGGGVYRLRPGPSGPADEIYFKGK
jgi:hypothetical protein